MVLYSYIMWILSENNTGNGEDDGNWLPGQPLSVPGSITKNTLSNEILPSDEIGIRGWWMAHEKWTVDVECFNEEWGVCVKVFSIPCKVDSVRSIYQWVPLNQDLQITELEFSLRSTAEDLRREASDAFYGALGLVKLSDQTVQTIQIKYTEENHYNLKKKTIFTASENSTISSVTIMLCCYGYVGLIKFMDTMLMFSKRKDEYLDVAAIVSSCPHVSSSNNLPVFATEQLNISKQGLTNYLHQVTLVTQVSMDRLGILERSLSSWDGPVSIAIFIPYKLQNSQDDIDWPKMYSHKKLQQFNNNINFVVTLVKGQSDSDEYPINYLRNIAIRQASTEFIFLVDADFTPAADFQPKFDVVTRAYRHVADKTAWVVPAFEFLEPPNLDEEFPKTKEDLVEQILADNSNIQPFRITESPESHRLTDYWHWYRAEHPYEIHGYNDKYEPYVVLKKSGHLPLYSQHFTGYGMNKVSHITELHAAGYNFRVLHDLWAIHLPHRTTSYMISFLQNPLKRLYNRAIRYEFLAKMMKKHNLKSCQNVKITD